MTNPTSNFGWQMPTSTDLVTDLPADFEVFGQAVDTSLADLKGGTTGQVLSKATGTDMDFTWTTIVSGGMTLISSTTLSGSAVNLTSIPQTYKDLRLVIRSFRPSTDNATMQFRINSDSGAKYTDRDTSGFNASNISFTEAAWNGCSSDNGASTGILVADFFDYTNSTTWKFGERKALSNNATTPTNLNYSFNLYATNITDAISTLNIIVSAGTFTSGTALLYGVN